MLNLGAVSEILQSKPIHVYGENVAGQVLDGRHLADDVDFTRDAQTVAISFSGFDSPACGIRSYEWALGESKLNVLCGSHSSCNCLPLIRDVRLVSGLL